MLNRRLRGSADGYVWVWRDGEDDHLAMGSHELGFKSILPIYSNPKLIAINVGAHVGTWAIRLARWNRKVYAYEANPDTFSVLKDNINYNSVEDKVHPINAAVWDSSGKYFDLVDENDMKTGGSTRIEVHPQETTWTYNPLDLITYPDIFNLNQPNYYSSGSSTTTVSYRKSAASVTLDDEFLDRGKVGLILIDVEGAEGGVLRGSKELILRDRPILIIEMHDEKEWADEDLVEQVHSVLNELNYHIKYIEVCPTEKHILARPIETIEMGDGPEDTCRTYTV